MSKPSVTIESDVLPFYLSVAFGSGVLTGMLINTMVTVLASLW